MEKLWQNSNFSLGLHTQPGKVPNGDQFCFSVENLVANREGYLVLGPEIRDVVTGTKTLSGVAEAAGHILSLRDGVPSIQRLGLFFGPETELTLPHTSFTLSGRLTAIAPRSSDYLIFCTEGNDSGFWVDLRSGKNFATYFLGIPPPLQGPTLTGRNEPSGHAVIEQYLYRYTYVREFNDPSEPFHGVESNASPVVARTLEGGLPTEPSDDATPRAIQIDGFTPPAFDGQYTGYALYRSENVGPDYRLADEDPDLIPFRRIAYIPKDATAQFIDVGYAYRPDYPIGTRAEDVSSTDLLEYDFSECPLYEPGNDRLPSTVTSFVYVGGRIYAACGDEVRFSDIRGLSFDLWRFPDNLVPPATDRVDFVAGFTDVVLFGARDAIYRVDLDHTNIDRISDRGPLDPFSIAQTERGLSFISSDGIYATDGVQVANVVDLALDDEFRDFRSLTGNVISLGEYGAIFQAKGTDIGDSALNVSEAFLFHDGAFWKLSIDPSQFVSFVRFQREFLMAEGTTLRAIEPFQLAHGIYSERDWSWQSQEFDLGTRLNKAFTELRFQTSAGVAVELTAVCDGREKVIEFETVDRFQPQRVRVDMRGRRFQFKISGTGPIVIRNMELWGRIIER